MIACTNPQVRCLFLVIFLFFRIKRRILLLIPKWIYEDIPNIENSNVVKMLQVTKHHQIQTKWQLKPRVQSNS